MPDIESIFSEAVKHHQSGRLQDAEVLYRHLLVLQPNHPETNHNLGILALQVNQPEAGIPYLRAALESDPGRSQFWAGYLEALACTGQRDLARQTLAQGRSSGLTLHGLEGLLEEPSRRALEGFMQALHRGSIGEAEHLASGMTENFPDSALAWNALGMAMKLGGRPEEAIRAMQRCVLLNPGDAKALFNLGLMQYEAGNHEDAEDSYRKAVSVKPDYAEAHSNLGNILRDLNRLPEAEESCRKAISIQPDHFLAHLNLGAILFDRDRFSEAESCFLKAISVKPDLAEAHLGLGGALYHLGRIIDAESSLRKAISLKHGLFRAHANLGNVLKDMGWLPDAEASYRLAISIHPDYAEAHSHLGATLLETGKLTDAEESCRKAIAIKPEYGEAHINLGCILLGKGNHDDAQASFRKAMEIRPGCFEGHSNLLMGFNYRSDGSKAYAEAVEYGKAVRKKASPFDSWTCPESGRVRVGLVSGDFRNHPVGHFLESILSELDPGKVELFAYPTSPLTDSLTDRIRPHFSQWHPLCGLNDETAAKLVHAHGIHVLIDLSGHTACNRLPLFAWKPAPIQASWLGYFATTGVSEIDYILGDPHVTPEGHESQFAEKIWRLPDTRMCFTPPRDAPEVSPLPALRNGLVTFGSFQNLAKASDETLALWSKVLEAVPESQLRWQCGQFADRNVIDMTRSRLKAFGIERADLVGPVNRQDYLAMHAEVDFILDTFPFTGGTTTCEALWMGVPTLTLAGNTLISRQGLGLMTAAGLPEWAVHTPEEYVSRAVEFAGSRESLDALRKQMRERVLSSPLFDSRRFARNLENAFHKMCEAHTGSLR